MTRQAFGTCALALGIMLGAAAPAPAQTTEPAMDPVTLEAAIDTLAAKAGEAGTVRVVLVARAARNPDGECAGEDGAGHCLARALAETGAAFSEQIPGTAYVTAELTADQLRAAYETGLIAALQEDTPQPPQ